MYVLFYIFETLNTNIVNERLYKCNTINKRA